VALRSVTPALPIGWGGDVRPHTLIGHRDTVNTSLTVDFLLEDVSSTALVGVRAAKLISTHGALLQIGNSSWALFPDISLRGRPTATGPLPAPIHPGEWHTVRMDANGSALSIWLDGVAVSGTIPPLSPGSAGHALLGCGGFGEFVQFDNFALASQFTACPAADTLNPNPHQPLQIVQCASEVGLHAGSGFLLSAPTGGPGSISLKSDPTLCFTTTAPSPGLDDKDAGWPVTLETCAPPGSPSQTWQWVFDAVCPQNKRNSKIINPSSGRCLDMGPSFYTLGGLGLTNPPGSGNTTLGDFPNEGASGIIGASMLALPCPGEGQSSSQNFFYDSNSGEIMNQGSVTCVGVCTAVNR